MKSVSVILAAAGEGRRLYSEGLFFAKPLFYYQTKPIIIHLLDQYREISDDIVVAISGDEKGQFLRAYLLDYYQCPDWLSFYTQKEFNGTNELVSDCLKLIRHSKALISWSDFVLKESIKPYLGQQDLFFTADIRCRFSLQNGVITHQTADNGFPGIYYLTHLPKLNLDCEDFLENFLGQSIRTQHLELINLGTVEELVKSQAFSSHSNRFFNSLTFKKDRVIKTALDSHAIELQKREANWYAHADHVRGSIPDFLYHPEKHQLVLERISGKPISQINPKNLGLEFWRKKLPKLLSTLHQPSKVEVDLASVYDTYIEKAIERVKQTWHTLESWFGLEPVVINGLAYGSPESDTCIGLINDWLDRWKDQWAPKCFTFIHGDINFDNLMLEDSGRLVLIDPRGYFGQTLLYGDPVYDVAKIFYALDGYDQVNSGNFLLGKTNRGTILALNQTPWDRDVQWFWNWCQEQYGITLEQLNFLLSSIWFSLTGYILNRPQSIIAAYCKGVMRSRS